MQQSDWDEHAFWVEEYRQRRMASYRARFYSWRTGRPVVVRDFLPHWMDQPLMWGDTSEYVLASEVELCRVTRNESQPI